MISRLTKIQLVIFAIVTVIGGAFVGGRYAQVDRLFVDRSFPVSAQFKDSGGIFAGAQVTYRGIPVGKVGNLQFKDSGVEATLDIENDAPKIPSDVLAIVANKSAVGEQFVDLQPRANSGPYLASGSTISLQNTRIPIDTTTLLVDFNDLVSSVNTDSVRTVVDELGQAFEGAGPDLGTILDTSSEFISTASDNIDVTRGLILNSQSVLKTQIDQQDSLATFSKNLALFSDSLVNADPDVRRLIDGGTQGARALRTVIDENSVDLGNLVNNLVTAQRPISKNITGLESIFVLYPYLLEGGFTVTAPSTDKGEFDATFGIMTEPPPPEQAPPACTYSDDGGPASGYRARRDPEDITDREFVTTLDCKVKDNDVSRQSTKTNFNRSAASGSGTALQDVSLTGKDSWKWLVLGPVTQ
ncbi:MCE family protein [Aeromicrobium sp.]|uniref:MCE family protein n=1 Tax=Aeromicrobium sp. TaxID=1871063 RepID=UPI003C613905